jgi:hypothetical protein
VQDGLSGSERWISLPSACPAFLVLQRLVCQNGCMSSIKQITGTEGDETHPKKAVFLLWHSHDLGNGVTDDKLIGVYSSEAEAEAASLRKLQFEGFREAPEGFCIEKYELDRDYWSEGYVIV